MIQQRLHPRFVIHPQDTLRKIGAFAKKNAVLLIALACAAVTSVIVPPDAAYLDYFDLKTLTCLFCTLAVVCALKNIHFFTVLARKIVQCTGNLRMAALALVWVTFIGSMLISNDMALLTFLPLGFFVLTYTGMQKYMAFVFIMQNIAANLGGMLTPFGNPQNLYLYSFFNIPTGEFMGIMAIPFAAAIALITICCLFLPRTKLDMPTESEQKLPVARTVIYLVLFALALVVVFRIVPYWLGLIVITAALLLMDRKALCRWITVCLPRLSASLSLQGTWRAFPQSARCLAACLKRIR